MSEPIEILYRDSAMVIVHKPSGLAVHRGWAQDRDYALTRTRDTVGQYVYPVHRLDRSTSGILIFALDKDSAAAIQHQFAESRVLKIYLALVRGHPGEPNVPSEIDHPLRKEGQDRRQDARTRFVRIGNWERYGWVLASPCQGRLHQIRRHFKHISAHLIGDVRYGKGEHNRYARHTLGLHRLALHALSLRIQSPARGLDWIEVTCAPTGALANALAASMETSALWAKLSTAQARWVHDLAQDGLDAQSKDIL